MKRSTLAGAVAVCLCFGGVAPLLAAEPTGAVTAPISSNEKRISGNPSAKACQSDLRAFNGEMSKDGYWPGGSAYGFGYPMGSYPMGSYPAESTIGYMNARPGYEVRALLASANILARNGQQDLCENVLAATRDVYKRYIADMHSGKVPMTAMSDRQNPLLASAVPVTGGNRLFRSDELVDAVLRTPGDVVLGSVDDIVMSPKTGKIAYLVIARGGIFGIDEKYVPVPWDDFKVVPNMDLFVLDTTNAAMDAAPQVSRNQFAPSGHFDQESQKVDAYWKAHLARNGNN